MTTGDAVQAPGTTTQEPAEELTLEQTREQIGRLREALEQSKREKSNLEREREARAELERRLELANAQLEALTMQGGNQSQQNGEAVVSRLMRAQRGLIERADAGDDEAALLLELIANQRQINGGLREVSETVELAESERDGIKRIRAEARKRGETISNDTARKLLKLEAAEAAPPARKEPEPIGETTPTKITPVLPSRREGGSNPTTFKEYGERMAALRDAGNDEERDRLMKWRRDNPGAMKPD